MVATITTNKIFSGKIYAKDNPNSCVVDVENDIQFSISMTYNDIGCDVKREELGVYTNQVSVGRGTSCDQTSDNYCPLSCTGLTFDPFPGSGDWESFSCGFEMFPILNIISLMTHCVLCR